VYNKPNFHVDAPVIFLTYVSRIWGCWCVFWFLNIVP